MGKCNGSIIPPGLERSVYKLPPSLSLSLPTHTHKISHACVTWLAAKVMTDQTFGGYFEPLIFTNYVTDKIRTDIGVAIEPQKVWLHGRSVSTLYRVLYQ